PRRAGPRSWAPAGGVAALLSANGRTPEVALIFGDHPDPNFPLTAFAAGMHKEWGMDADQVIAGRRAEEAVASLTLGACDRYLPFRDAIYREDRYTQSDQLMGADPHPDDASIPSEIVTALNLTPADKPNTRLYAPLAIGRHVDHQLAFAAGKLLLDDGWAVWFYEDLPYALYPANVSRRLPEVEAMGLAPVASVGVGSVWTKKIDAIMAYPSQLSTIFGQYVGVGSTRDAIDGEMARYAELAGEGTRAERFWSAGG
ncbi:MAG TPA: hypothetical protein PK819_14635, partial [Thermomicrobiales bacterium]|nr:hypothetical protein [Thermomicrobiales bacterium]